MSKQATVNNNPACVRLLDQLYVDLIGLTNIKVIEAETDMYNVKFNFSVLYIDWPTSLLQVK